MKQINANEFHKELERLGIATLTGEGCGLGTRLVTDVSPKALPFVESYFGMELKHKGMNGWSQDPDGKWIPGCTKSYDWENKCRRQGWNKADGFCFNLPRSMRTELLIWLLLNEKRESVIYYLYDSGKMNVGRFVDMLLIFDGMDEWVAFRDEMYGYEESLNAGDDPKQHTQHPYLVALQKFNEWAHARLFLGDNAKNNTHYMSGRTIE